VVSAAQRSFGRRLRDQRERAGTTLAAIADATKIKRSLLEELERGDLSTWPGGIFRRAFVRAYATAIGLPPESVVEEFVQVFPESGAADSAADHASELRLTLVVDPWRRVAASVINVIVPVVEAGAIVAVAWLAAWISAVSIWSACAVISLAYYALSTACLGRSPAAWCLQHGLPSFSHRRPTRRSQTANARELIHLVQRRERTEDQIHDDPTRTPSPEPLRAATR